MTKETYHALQHIQKVIAPNIPDEWVFRPRSYGGSIVFQNGGDSKIEAPGGTAYLNTLSSVLSNPDSCSQPHTLSVISNGRPEHSPASIAYSDHCVT